MTSFSSNNSSHKSHPFQVNSIKSNFSIQKWWVFTCWTKKERFNRRKLGEVLKGLAMKFNKIFRNRENLLRNQQKHHFLARLGLISLKFNLLGKWAISQFEALSIQFRRILRLFGFCHLRMGASSNSSSSSFSKIYSNVKKSDLAFVSLCEIISFEFFINNSSIKWFL